MRASDLLTVFFAAGAVAVPLAKRTAAVTHVLETDIYDQSGKLVDKKFKVVEPEAAPAAPLPAAAAPHPAAAAPVQKQQPAPAKQEPKQPEKAKPQPAATAPVNQLADNSAGSTKTGWVDPTDPLFGVIATWHHNAHRANHSAGDVVYDDEMAKVAQAWAEKCIGDESGNGGYGMNVAFSSSDEGYNPSNFISGDWYNSELANFPAYGQGDLPVGEGTNFGKWGHFSQVVWPETKKIGCGIARCPNDPTFKVHAGCVYSPAGNMMGQFNKVNRPQNKPMVFPNGHSKM